MIERVKIVMEKENVSASQLADKLEIQRSGISHILSGRNKPSLDFVKKLLKAYPNYNAEWLLFGTGEMLNGVYKSKQRNELSLFDEEEIRGMTIISPQKNINERMEKEMYPKTETIRKEQSVIIPETRDNESQVSKIILIYEDKSFEELKPR